MTLTDAGALVALVDKNQPQNARCRATFAVLSLPLITTWPAFTEAMYLVYQIGGWPLQRNAWRYVEEGTIQIHSSWYRGSWFQPQPQTQSYVATNVAAQR